MENGFTFKNIHSRSLGVSVKSENRPIIPEVKKAYYAPLCMDGEYDFSTANPLNREFYNSRIFEIQMYISGADIKELNKKLTKISLWLTGEGDLIFDDAPYVKWRAKRYSGISYAPEIKGKRAIIAIQFEVSAFASCIWSTQEEIILNSQAEIGINLPLDITQFYTFDFNLPCYTAANNCPTTQFSFVNFGDRPIKPVVTISSDTGMTNVNLFYENEQVQILMAWGVKEVVIDFNTQLIRYEYNGKECFAEYTGNLKELPPGENVFEMFCVYNAPAAAGNICVTVDFNAQTMWDFDFDSVDWRKHNA